MFEKGNIRNLYVKFKKYIYVRFSIRLLSDVFDKYFIKVVIFMMPIDSVNNYKLIFIINLTFELRGMLNNFEIL